MSLQDALKDAAINLTKGRSIQLIGRNAEGLFHYLKQHLPNDFGLKVIDSRKNKGASISANTVVGVEFRNGKLPSGLGDKLIIIDQENHLSSLNKNKKSKDDDLLKKPFSMGAEFYINDERTHDLDIMISKATANLYLDVFDAFVTYHDQPFFDTTELIDYERSKPILMGLLESAMDKFPRVEVIAGREILKAHGQKDVRMYEIAKMLAKRIGIDYAKIEKTEKTDHPRHNDYIIRRNNLQGKKILLLEEVLETGKTIEALKKTINYTHGKYQNTVVLIDISREVHKSDIYALTNKDVFENLRQEREEMNGKD